MSTHLRAQTGVEFGYVRVDAQEKILAANGCKSYCVQDIYHRNAFYGSFAHNYGPIGGPILK